MEILLACGILLEELSLLDIRLRSILRLKESGERLASRAVPLAVLDDFTISFLEHSSGIVVFIIYVRFMIHYVHRPWI